MLDAVECAEYWTAHRAYTHPFSTILGPRGPGEGGPQVERGGGDWHKASVSDCLPLAAPIGLLGGRGGSAVGPGKGRREGLGEGAGDRRREWTTVHRRWFVSKTPLSNACPVALEILARLSIGAGFEEAVWGLCCEALKTAGPRGSDVKIAMPIPTLFPSLVWPTPMHHCSGHRTSLALTVAPASACANGPVRAPLRYCQNLCDGKHSKPCHPDTPGPSTQVGLKKGPTPGCGCVCGLLPPCDRTAVTVENHGWRGKGMRGWPPMAWGWPGTVRLLGPGLPFRAVLQNR